MNREQIILRHIDKTSYGLEIGPSHNPIAPKRQGYRVDIIDHMSQAQLIEKYQGHGVNLANIEPVDFVWQGERYADLTGKPKFYDWIIASHVIEHTPDLIGFLQDCDTILKDDGIISLVVPDKRYCFDHYRPITGLAQIIDSHLQKHTIHTPGTVADYYLNVVAKAGQIAWGPEAGGDYSFVHSLSDAQQGMQSVIHDQIYRDVHAWCFVPHSFRLMIQDLFSLGLIPFQELDFAPTMGCEFYITLSRRGTGCDQSRLHLLEQIASELQVQEPGPQTVPPSQALKARLKHLIKRVT